MLAHDHRLGVLFEGLAWSPLALFCPVPYHCAVGVGYSLRCHEHALAAMRRAGQK